VALPSKSITGKKHHYTEGFDEKDRESFAGAFIAATACNAAFARPESSSERRYY